MREGMRQTLLVFIFCAIFFPVSGKSADRDRYNDIDLYLGWNEAELRDSVYHKAYREYIADSAGNGRLDRLERLTGDKTLPDAYRDILSSGGDKIPLLVSLSDRAARKRETAMELESLNAAFTEAFWRAKDYDRAFYIGFRLMDRLPQVSQAGYPYKRETYYKLGEAYYLMLDFHRSIQLLENALSPSPAGFDDRVNLDALNIMGICYANIGQMDVSDAYFRATLLSGDIVLNRPLYNAYALSHLGCNAMLTGLYDKALAISRVAWPVLRQESGDYGHLAGMCYCRGRSHLEKGDFKQASMWIDSLVYFANQDQYNHIKRIKQAHSLRADYYTAIGDARRAKIYNDSLAAVYKHGEEGHISGYIARGLQHYNDEKIADREARLQTGRVRLVSISIVAGCCFAAAYIILSLYRRKNAAYKALAQKADLWAREEVKAGTSSAVNGKTYKDGATESDTKIMSLAEREMISSHAHREPELTVELLADRIGVHRNSLSQAINRVTGGNFKQYINGYRIKEAIRIISESEYGELYIEELYERVGYSNRSSFYRVFKQFTGLSPAEFRKNSYRAKKNAARRSQGY